MKAITALLFALTLATTQAADSPDTAFPKVGETYQIQMATPLTAAPYGDLVTIIALGQNQWVKVEYEKMGRGAEGAVRKEKREMWVNFAQVITASKAVGGR